MSQTQDERIVDLIDGHFISNSVLTEADFDNILHYVELEVSEGEVIGIEPEVEF